MRPQAIIFDCDGVLIDSERIAIAIERDHIARLGLVYDFETYVTRFVGLRTQDYYAAVRKDFEALGTGTLPETFEQDIHDATWRRFEAELEAIEDLETFLDSLNVPFAVGSSSGVLSLNKKLRLTGLHHRFDPHIYSGEQVERGKPAPDLFLLAAEKLGMPPDGCLVIEDSVNGVKAGRAAGMTVWGFTGGGHVDNGLAERLRSAGAHAVHPHYAAVAAMWASLS